MVVSLSRHLLQLPASKSPARGVPAGAVARVGLVGERGGH